MSLRFVISPAKKMRAQDSPPWPVREPALVGRAEVLARAVRDLGRDEAQRLWACSDRLADLNYERFRSMDLHQDTTAAVVAYEGIQYTHLAAGVMSERELEWLDEHLRILSGLYGILRPLDGVVPYRLEMQRTSRPRGRGTSTRSGETPCTSRLPTKGATSSSTWRPSSTHGRSRHGCARTGRRSSPASSGPLTGIACDSAPPRRRRRAAPSSAGALSAASGAPRSFATSTSAGTPSCPT